MTHKLLRNHAEKNMSIHEVKSNLSSTKNCRIMKSLDPCPTGRELTKSEIGYRTNLYRNSFPDDRQFCP